MKATGIVRRIDDLGRVVVPKEIRKTLRIREGDPLEIYVGREGEIILKKYSPIEELGEFARQYAEAANQNTGHTVLITDMDQVIAGSGVGKKEAQNKRVTNEYVEILMSREQVMSRLKEKTHIALYEGMDNQSSQMMITPIISDGDVIGGIVILEKGEKSKLGQVEEKVAQVGATYLGSQME